MTPVASVGDALAQCSPGEHSLPEANFCRVAIDALFRTSHAGPRSDQAIIYSSLTLSRPFRGLELFQCRTSLEDST